MSDYCAWCSGDIRRQVERGDIGHQPAKLCADHEDIFRAMSGGGTIIRSRRNGKTQALRDGVAFANIIRRHRSDSGDNHRG